MAIVTRRYALRGPTNTSLAKFVGGAAVVASFPAEAIDISIDNAIPGAIDDLDAYMLTMGFEFIAADIPIRAFNATLVAPTFGVNLASQSRAGRSMLSQRGPVGAAYQLQSALYGNKASLWTAQGNGTGVSLINFGNLTTGSATTRNCAVASFAGQLRQLAFVSATPSGSSCGTRHNMLQFWRGNAPGLGGFFYVVRFVIDTVNAGMRWFVGFSGSAAVIGNVDPSTLTNIVGFGIDSAQTTVRFFSNDAAGVAAAVDLGVNFPATTAAIAYEARIYCAPNGAAIGYSLERLDTGVFVEGSAAADIPAGGMLLSPQIWMNNGATAGAVAVSVVSQYSETDV